MDCQETLQVGTYLLESDMELCAKSPKDVHAH